MEETLISCDTATLAQEKGFNIQGYKIYNPTQSLLQKWLRETYDIHVFVQPYINEPKGVNKLMYERCISTTDNIYDAILENIGTRFKTNNPFMFLYNSYEEAFEQGLFEALNLIKI
jgi:hypothetical protein